MKKKFHKIISVPAGVRFTVCVVLIATFASLAGCVKEDRDNCPSQALLYIVADAEGADDAGAVEEATVFLFNDDRTYLSSIEVSGENIAAGVPVPISYDRDNLPWAVVWGNLAGSERVPAPSPGQRMEDMFVYMGEDAEGNAIPADRLFYGAKRLEGNPVEYITITPKTGRISITARGLPYIVSDRYYYTAETPYNRYDFTGTPLRGVATLRLNGEFRGNDFMTTQPYHLFHFPSPGADDEHLTVRLYDNGTGTGGDVLLATAETDTEGIPIAILRGRTTNVLIDMLSGSAVVSVQVTDWDKIYDQWNEW